jgi:hypothetical protein
VIIAFQLVFPVEPTAIARCISLLALFGLFLNGPYFLAARTGRAFRAQAYVRMLVDVLLLSVGLYFAGGIAAAHFIGVYLIVMIFAGITFSSRACLVATAAATVSYITIVSLQQGRALERAVRATQRDDDRGLQPDRAEHRRLPHRGPRARAARESAAVCARCIKSSSDSSRRFRTSSTSSTAPGG